jgi:hypothetical protein
MLRVPKLFWTVNIEWYGRLYGDTIKDGGIWTANFSEHPSFLLLHEVWEAEYAEACLKNAEVKSPRSGEGFGYNPVNLKEIWEQRFKIARFLTTSFKRVDKNKKGLPPVSQFDSEWVDTKADQILYGGKLQRELIFNITVSEEVLH